MKKKKTKVPGKQGKQICLTEGQIKTVLDTARGKEEEVCDAAVDFIKDIDDSFNEGFEKRTKLTKKQKKSFADRWL